MAHSHARLRRDIPAAHHVYVMQRWDLAGAIAANKRLLIVADYDCGGATACALAGNIRPACLRRRSGVAGVEDPRVTR